MLADGMFFVDIYNNNSLFVLLYIVRRKTTILTLLLVCVATAWGQASSVLASGDWWRLAVQGTGVYRLTVDDVPGLDGAEVSQIGLYGGSGEMLSLNNSQTPVDDLRPVAIEVHDADGDGRFGQGDWLLFFGEGTDVWSYVAGDRRWEMTRHSYATANHYYLTTTAAEPLRIAVAAAPVADTVMGDYTAVAMVNRDQTNVYRTGQTWLGEKFTVSSATRNFTLSLPATASGITLRYALASISSATGTFNISTTGFSRSNSITTSGKYSTVLEAINARAQSLNFTIRYIPGESTAEGYLDFIEITGIVPLALGSGQTLVRNNRHLGSTAAFRYSGGSGLRVWEVTKAGREREMALADGQWVDYTTEARMYVAFDGSNYLAPAAVAKISNQDLHGAAAADLVVVCHPRFVSQAQRIALLHELLDGMETLVVTDQQVYNEFSGGKQDPMAMRSFLRHLRKSHPERAPRYLLLFGKASYDPRNILGNSVPTLVTYETVFSFDDDGGSYSSDDMMGYLDDNESGGSAQSLDVSVGRLPAKDEAEATHLVDKIEGYMMRRDLGEDAARGSWRNFVALLADDADPSRAGDTVFAHSSEVTAKKINASYPDFNVERLYADAYRQQNNAIGSFYPELKNALTRRIDNGCLLLNYIGHGSVHYIGTERYVEPSDINAYSNAGRLPLLVTSTCSYGYHDLVDEICGAEAFLLASGGAVSVISATRPISHMERFNSDVILYALDTAYTIGDALRMAKNRTVVSPCISLLGDPALHLSVPSNVVEVTNIDGHDVDAAVGDTATVLSQVTVRGEIRNTAGELVTDFDGTIYPTVYDREMMCHTMANDNPGTEVAFCQQKNVLYRGAAPVTGGRFEYTFMVPRDVAYQYAPGKLSHYAVSGYEHAAGSYKNLYFGGLNEEVVISETRPQIALYLGDENFRNGGLTDASPMLVAHLSDSVGINAFGSGLGHDITVMIDNKPGSMTVLNDFYESDISDSRRGTVRYPLEGITSGNHTLTLKAWNIWGFSNTATIAFRVQSTDTLEFCSMTVAPNPAKDYAEFRYETNGSANITSAVLQVYSPQGGLMYSVEPTVTAGSYVVGPVRWDLSQVSPGMYLARMLVTTDDGETHQSTAKVIVR